MSDDQQNRPDETEGQSTPANQPDGGPDDALILGSGARITDRPAADPDAPTGISRRKLLTGAGIGAVAAAAIGVGVWAGVRGSGSTANTPTLRLAYGGDTCEAPLFAAHEKGFFAKQGLDVEIVKTATGEDTHPAVGSGKYAAAPGIFFSWLKPIEQGVDVKLVAGLHEGCLRLVVRDDGDITSVNELRGKKIGVSGLSSSALNFFSLDLLDAGIVPSPEAKQVEWVVIDNDLLPTALKEKRIDAIAASDPIALLATLGGDAQELTNNRLGANAQQYCCATALNGKLVRDDPETARKLVTAWAEGSRWVGANIEETAHIEVEKNYVAGKVEQIVPILQSYSYNPSAKNLRAALIPGIEKFAGTGFLDPRTKAPDLADKVYADLGLSW
ncbi:ABC transporter substrate-binding protein [Gordonia soli]|uniref:Putative ABC transporter substrate-binding protein n=1 Tax=Gordonia soli NBRC 108243 TaxID=1223545 RepID=M0QE57_9ACTN|nr:ABC transporter substrate-binding protein [Gordonia soli]GAC66734.1 putative ABC transporter substrate-binding protein [Gordonia soli NBRC 108243]